MLSTTKILPSVLISHRLVSRVIQFSILFLLSNVIRAQHSGKETTHKFSFQHKAAEHILNIIESELDVTFNYSADAVTQEQYTFSIEGTRQLIVEGVCDILQRRCSFLENNVVLIGLDQTSHRSQPRTIKGQIFDELGHNIPFAYLTIPSLGIQDISDINGFFEISAFTSPSDTIIIEHLGFKVHSVKVDEFGETTDVLTITLQPEDHILNEIVITGNNGNTSTQIEVLTPNKDYIPSSSVDKDVFQVAQSASGVYLPSESISDLLIRGGSPDHIQYKWNGIQVFQNSHFYGKISSINPFMVDKIKITKNGYSSDNSGQIGGSISFSDDAISKKDEFFVHANLLYINAGTNLSLLKNKLNFKVSTRHSHPDNWPSPIYSNYVDQIFQFGKLPDQEYYINFFEVDEFIIRKNDIDFSDTNTHLNFKVSDQHEISASYVTINNDFDRTAYNTFTDTTELDNLHQSNSGWSISSKHRWNQQLSTDISYSTSQYNYNYSSFRESTNPASIFRTQQNALSQTQINIDQSFISKWLLAKIGFQKDKWDVFVFDTDLSIADMEPYVLLNSQGSENSFYGNLSVSPSEHIKIDAGMRWSYYNRSLNDRIFKEPRIHISLLASDQLKFHVHYGKFHQQLNRRNFFTPLQADNGFWYISDEQSNTDFIFTIQSEQASLGATYQRGSFFFGANIYEKEIYNIWTSVLDFSIEENPYRFADIEINGIELEAKYRLKGYSSTVTYDYINEEIFIQDTDLIIRSPFSQPHRVSINQSISFNKISLSAQWRYATGRPFSVPTTITTAVNDRGESYYIVNFPELLSDQVEDYHSLDFGVNYNFSLGKNKSSRGSLGLQVTNIYNRKNILKNQYFIDYKTDPVQLGLLEKSGLPTSYNLSLEYRF